MSGKLTSGLIGLIAILGYALLLGIEWGLAVGANGAMS
jgi:hypothetical protein